MFLSLLACAALLRGSVVLAHPPEDKQYRRRTAVVDVFEAARDSVVNVSTTEIVEIRSPFGIPTPFEGFFEMPRSRRRIERESVGSGFVLHPAGYIITNAHVVARTAQRKAIFANGDVYEAELISIDEDRDLAVLKIDAGRLLPPIRLGTSSDLMVGEPVVAIGNPFGFQHSVTVGVISALNRSLQIDHDRKFDSLIQTDASINPGNSGGPLLNILGEVVGVNTAIRADAENIGFAIPADSLRQMLPDMLDVERRYGFVTGLAVRHSVVDAGISRVAVAAVQAGSPAQEAGLAPGMTILSIEQQPVQSVIDYHIALIGRAPGQKLSVQVQRNGVNPSLVTLELARRLKPDGAALLQACFGMAVRPWAKVHDRRRGRIRALTVFEVEPTSPAARAGVMVGDGLIQVGKHQPTDLDDLGLLLEKVNPGEQMFLGILRLEGAVMYRFGVVLRAR